MRASSPSIPHIPAALIPFLDAVLPRTGPLHRHSPEELARMRGHLPWVCERYGAAAPIMRRVLLVIGLEYARAEVIA